MYLASDPRPLVAQEPGLRTGIEPDQHPFHGLYRLKANNCWLYISKGRTVADRRTTPIQSSAITNSPPSSRLEQ